MNWITWLGLVAATFTTTSFLLQATKIIITCHTKDLSLWMYLILTGGGNAMIKKVILTVSLISILIGCATTPRPVPRVTSDSPFALIEIAQMGTFLFGKLDGEPIYSPKYRNGKRWEGGVYIPPGNHTLEVDISHAVVSGTKKQKEINERRPLYIEINAKAGHNYMIKAWAYDEMTISLWIEDINTGECVAGRRADSGGDQL